jgi:hypothetical protein
MVDPLLLTRIGLELGTPRSHIRIATVSDVRRVPLYIVPEIAAFGRRRQRVPVLGHPLPVTSHLDGLLGLGFFRGYRLTIDLRLGTIEME